MAVVRFPFNHFDVNTPEEFRQKMAAAGYEVPVHEDLDPLRGTFVVNGHRIENSMAVQPLEGLDGCENGAPSNLTLARYEKLAAEGAGILWVEATAVAAEGRDSNRQLWLHTGSLEGFKTLVRTIDEAAAKAGHKPPYKVIQLTHSGRCSVDAAGQPAPVAAFASPYLDPLMGTPQIVTDAYLDQLQDRIGDAAALAAEAGFDAVELKLCHQYLFKELLCAYTRPGKYGGSQENRFRFALGAVDQIRRRLGSRIGIAVRLNAYDGIPWPYGWGMQPHPDGAPKNVLPIGDAAQIYGVQATGVSIGTSVASNWSGNPDYRISAAREGSNWSGNPSPLRISDEEKSSWQGNPGFERNAEAQNRSWQGNAAFRRDSLSEKSNWSGNPSPLQISDEEKSSWQGNLACAQLTGSALSNWPGNPDYQQVSGREGSNWSGNPSPLAISDQEKSSWQGNPGFERGADQQDRSWQGNASFQRGANIDKSNWSGNPSPLHISDEEKSSWQGNPRRDQVEGSAASNWPGNPEFVPAACRGCTASTETCATCPVLQQAGVASNWQGNPGFVPEACRSCTAASGACTACEVAQAANAALTIPPMPGPMQVDLNEVKELMLQLYRRGIRLFNLTTTSPRFAPAGSGYLDNFSDTAQVDPFAGVSALLQATKEIRQVMPGDIRIVGTGLSWFGPFSANVAAGGIAGGWFDIAGFGRSVMADNGFIPSILQGRQPDRTKACVGCDNCFRLFFAGLPTGCPMQHSAYAELFQRLQSGGGNVIL